MYGAASKLQSINCHSGEYRSPRFGGSEARFVASKAELSFMRPVALAGILASTTMLGGCAGTIGGVTLSSISSFAGFASTIFTGADLGEHAASLVTGKDCRFSEGLMREDRDVCEEPGSLATRDDFHGIFVERIDADGTIIFAAPKYMPSGVGAGESETTPDRLWAEIKAGKAKEENERQLARANNATQTIDVAALATGSLSSESLAFLPTGAVEIADGETASQTASAPVRPVINAAKPKAEKKAQMTTVAADLPLDQPAIEEVALTAPLKAAKENGQGGPLITMSGSSAPVVSTLINGEPVVILRLQPMLGVAAASDTASAEPSPLQEEASTVVALPARSASVPSPLAVLNQAQPVAVAAVEPQLEASRPRTKPSAAELAPVTETIVEDVVEKPKPVRRKRTETAVAQAPQADVYQPPGRESEMASSTTPDLIAASPVQAPGDIPAAPMPSAPAPVATYVPSAEPSEPAAPATSGPAPLFPIAQP